MYPGGGARYVRHCDNACLAGEGEKCNGRRLTAILYLNPGWRDVDGGALEPAVVRRRGATARPLLPRRP